MKLVVFSIDAYSRIGPMFHQYLEDKWPEHFPCVYIANNLPINVPDPVVHIRAREMNFGYRLRAFLRHHYTDDTLTLMMIDYIPKEVNNALIQKSAQLLQRPDIGHIRLRPLPRPEKKWKEDADYGLIDKRKPYALSLQPGMWETQLLYDLARNGENAWHMETHGSKRTIHSPKTFLCTWGFAINHHNYYRKRRIDPIPKDAPWRIRGGQRQKERAKV